MATGDDSKHDLSAEALAFGQHAASELRAGPGIESYVSENWARFYEMEGAERAEEDLRKKVAFDRAWDEWRAATQALAAAGLENFGLPRWQWVSADLDSNRIRLLDGQEERRPVEVTPEGGQRYWKPEIGPTRE